MPKLTQREQKVLSSVDHTLLLPEAVEQDYFSLCDDAIRYGAASVCIPPRFVKSVVNYVNGKIPVCTVIGFPNGYNATEIKVAETALAVSQGAEEIDMVIAIGMVKDRKWDAVREEIAAVRRACEGKILKVIVETCLLSEEEKIRLCRIVGEAGADYIKTSTGFSKGGATLEDIRLFARHVCPPLRIKAAGGISSLEDAILFLEAGAHRLGTSRVIKEMKKKEQEEDQ